MRTEEKTQGAFQVETPAKVTLHLEITRRLDTGFHEVEILLAPVSLFDTLRFSPLPPGSGLQVTVQGREASGLAEEPPAQNLACRAVNSFFQSHTRFEGQSPADARLHLGKNIPIGAGLGGGSGNAAGMLTSLNMIYGHPLSPARMESLALDLGADVPFFLDPRPTLARGIGEKRQTVSGLPPLELLVVKPNFSISTGEAYRLAGEGFSQHRAAVAENPAPQFWQPVEGLSPEELAGRLFNRFESVLFPRYPELPLIRRRLLEAGALGASLSGSGSALFGVFVGASQRDAAQTAMAAEAGEKEWRLFPCHTLARHRYDLIF